jgi:uncharacterized membrane protein
MMFMGLGLLIPLGLAAAIIYALGQRPQNDGGRRHSHAAEDKPVLDILKERYAGGEISKEQYETIRHALSSSETVM